MRRSVARLKGIGFILWHTRHEFYHVLLGLLWAWILREIWQQFNVRWITVAVIGSLLPDLDHFFYFFIYGRKNIYSKQVKMFFKSREWRILWKFLETGHKYQTGLATHNFVKALNRDICCHSYHSSIPGKSGLFSLAQC